MDDRCRGITLTPSVVLYCVIRGDSSPLGWVVMRY